jgi:mannose-6-phosphate isomerase-like protein (cupin superfamily)
VGARSEHDLSDLFAAPLAGRVIGSSTASIVVAEWRDPGGQQPPMYIAPLHRHDDDDEAWYVLEGALCVRLGDRDVEVPSGAAVIARRGTSHTYWNPLPGPARYVLVMTPRIHALIEALHAVTDRTEESVAAIFRAHRSEYLGWPKR